MSDSVLSFDGVRFAYGRRDVLVGLDLEINRGEVTLLAAPNGTGKTTALWIAAGLLRPHAGELSAFGKDPHRERGVLGRVGFLAEGAPLPPTWSGRRVLDYQRATFPHWNEVEHGRLCKTLRLDLDVPVKQLSRGQRGSLGLLAVLSTKPELLLLDEPTLGLDVATRRALSAEILGPVADKGCAVLVAGHEIADAQDTADRFVLLEDGRVGCDESIPELMARHRVARWTVDHSPPGRLEPVMLHARRGWRALLCRWSESDAAEWVREANVSIVPADLETIYLGLVGALEHA